jgi:predicted secreted Zn-dependent protease
MANQMLAALCAALVLVTVESAETLDNIHFKYWLRAGQTVGDNGEVLNSNGLAFNQVYDNKGKAVQGVVRTRPQLT